MTALQVDDALRQIALLAHAKGEALAMLSQLHRDTLQLLVTSPKDRASHAKASQVLTQTLAEARRILEAHGARL